MSQFDPVPVKVMTALVTRRPLSIRFGDPRYREQRVDIHVTVRLYDQIILTDAEGNMFLHEGAVTFEYDVAGNIVVGDIPYAMKLDLKDTLERETISYNTRKDRRFQYEIKEISFDWR